MPDQDENEGQLGGGIAGFRVDFGETNAEEMAAEGTFRILVVGGFTASPDFATNVSPPRAPIAITPATFDEVMTELGPSLLIEVPDPSPSPTKPLSVRLSFRRLRSFRPDILLQEVEVFRSLRSDAPPPPAPLPAERPVPPAGEGSLIAEILAGMGATSSRPPSSHATTVKPGALAQPRSVAALLGAILGHPEVRRLERAWRGLRLLVDRAARGGVTILIASAGIDEVEDVVARSTRAIAEAGGAVDLIVVDYEVGPGARDLQRAERWASRAEAVPAPLLTNASPEVLGFNDLEELARTSRRVRSLEDPRAVAFRALTEKDATRWLLLAMNGVFARPAYTPETVRVRDVPFEERAPLDAGAAWIVAAAAANAFVGCGWACALTEPAYRTVRDLGIHEADDRGQKVAIAVESLLSSEVAAEAAAAGITALAAVRDRDAAILPFAQMVYRGPVGREGVRAAAELTLADQLFVARMVPLVTEVAVTIPRDADRGAARDTARIALLSILRPDSGQAPTVDVTISNEPAALQVTLRPRGFRGVRIAEITLSALLGDVA